MKTSIEYQLDTLGGMTVFGGSLGCAAATVSPPLQFFWVILAIVAGFIAIRAWNELRLLESRG